MGGREPAKTEKGKYIVQICKPHDPAMDGDPLKEFTPNILIGPVDLERKQSTLSGMIARHDEAIQVLREDPH